MEQAKVSKPIYRMSSAGKCPRALSAERQGYESAPVPAYLETAANEGRWHEQRIKDELRHDGLAVVHEQQELTLDYPDFTLVGHIDGIVTGDGTDKVLEIKSMSQFEFDRWMKQGFGGFPEYSAQLTCYMEATGLAEALYIVKNRSSGYKNSRTITEAPTAMDEIIHKLGDIESWMAKWIEPGAREGVYPADFDSQSIQCQRCFYQHLCITKPEPTEIDLAMLDKAVETWRKGKALAGESEALIDEARLTLGSYANGLDTKKFAHNRLAVQLVHYDERNTYPKDRLLKIFTEEQLLPAILVKEAYDQLRINDMAKEDEQK